ncbi:MAG: lecithin retinol acyltransferase family protein [Actinobacteria bacterium]|nr:lecithin retinol acyltransferase family protein [Actinomycetota bacterium]
MSDAEPDPGGSRSVPSGDHLRVRRPLGYSHHGIYVGDDRVIQFGGGTRDKPGATIGADSLTEFRNGGEARVVVHDGHPTAMGQLAIPDTPDRGSTNVSGRTCEVAPRQSPPGAAATT